VSDGIVCLSGVRRPKGDNVADCDIFWVDRRHYDHVSNADRGLHALTQDHQQGQAGKSGRKEKKKSYNYNEHEQQITGPLGYS